MSAIPRFIRDYVEGTLWPQRAKHIAAIRLDLVGLRTTLADAIDNGGAIRTDASKQFARQLWHRIKTIEFQIDAILGNEVREAITKPAPRPVQPSMGRLF